MKVYLNDLEIKSVYNLNFQSDPPIASLNAYPDILPEIFKHSQGELHGEVDGIWEAKLPFTKICTDDNCLVWDYDKWL